MFLFIYMYVIDIVQSLTFSYFTAPVFTDLEGWTLFAKIQTGNLIGTHDSISYVGLGFLKTSSTSDVMYKTYYSLPPHYGIRISGKYYTICQQDIFYGVQTIIIAIDQIQAHRISQFQQTPKLMEQIATFNFQQAHTADSVVIRIFHWTTELAYTTFGVRELKIEFLECPSGCLQCENGDQSQCSLWQKLDFKLSEIELWNFNNDGWVADGGVSNTIFVCNSNQKFNFFGLFNHDESISRDFILPPHYQLKFEVLVIFVQTDFLRGPQFFVQMDDQIIYSQISLISNSQPTLCSYFYLPVTIYAPTDYIHRIVTNTMKHNQQNMSLKFYVQQTTTEVQGKWGIRDFKIHLKKCHSSCTKQCNGPFATDCVDQLLSYTLYYSTFTTNSLTSQDGWQVIFPYTQFSICNGFQILGGYQILQGQNKLLYILRDLPIHTTLSVSFQLYQVDNFTNDLFNVYVDDTKVYEKTLITLTDKVINFNFCGNTDLDIISQINIDNINHNLPTAIFTFATNQAATSVGYWGIRAVNFKIDGRKLESTITKSKQNVATGWYEASNSLFTTTCTSASVDFIGYFQNDKVLQKVLKNIPSHTSLHVIFKIIVKYTTITQNQSTIQLKADGKIIWSTVISFPQKINLCDSTNYYMVLKFDEYFDHTNSGIFLELISDFQNDQYWAIRELDLEYH